MYKYATSIGLDIGRTMIRTALVRYGGELLKDFSFPYSEKPDRDKLINCIVDAVTKTRQKASEFGSNPLCVGIAAKGFINHRKGIIIGPDQGISGWENVELSRLVNDKTGLPVYVDNDANLMAIAELNYGAARNYSDIIFVALRSGIGGAFIMDGRLYRGMNNAAGEIGQMTIDLEGQYSDKGIKGSLEYFASSTALVRNYLAMQGYTQSDNTRPDSNIKAREVFEMYYKGDKHAAKAVKDNARFIGTGLANLISLYSPEIIILGGGMALAREDYIASIRDIALDNSLEHCSKDLVITTAALGNTASLQGSAMYALTRLDGRDI